MSLQPLTHIIRLRSVPITHTPVQENYVNHRPRLAKDDAQRLRIMAKAADAISAGDLATRVVRQQNNWTMAPFAGG